MKIGRSKSTPTAFSPLVAERRRLLLLPDRLADGGAVRLNSEEQHYLRRVLRLRCGGRVDVTDGCGRLWVASLSEPDLLQLDPTPQQIEPSPQPKLGLAVALVRRGLDDVIRMACELGIDRIQPLRCERCVPQAEHRPERWSTIVREAVEQCERLWMPQLLELEGLSQWIGNTRPVSRWCDPSNRRSSVASVVAPTGRSVCPHVVVDWQKGAGLQLNRACLPRQVFNPFKWDQPSCAVPPRRLPVLWNWCVGAMA